jgi:putative GTP pyrophosphokinase
MTSTTSDSNELAKIWDEKPEVIRAFLEIHPQYEQLCSEVEYILRKRMDEKGIEYSTITSRAKTLKSFTEKISRKQYDEPLTEITDLAGARIVYLYKSDLPSIEKIVEAEFQVIEKVDKVEEQESDRFGYGALHYSVNLGRKSSGARYDDLKGMICEIQVRTVLQDAWAIIDHHLVYKHESDVPRVLKRKLNSISGLFETADDQFDRIRAEREEYRKDVQSKLGDKDTFLAQETNLDTFIEFLKWKYPKKRTVVSDVHTSGTVSAALKYEYKTLSDIDGLLNRTRKARAAINKVKPAPSAANEVARAIALEKPEYRKTYRWNPTLSKLFNEHENMLSEK